MVTCFVWGQDKTDIVPPEATTIDGEKINFNILVQNWDENSTTYQVLDYTN